MFLNNGGVIDPDRQWLHFSNSVSQLIPMKIWVFRNDSHCFDAIYTLIFEVFRNYWSFTFWMFGAIGFTTVGNNTTTRVAHQIQSETAMDYRLRVFIAVNSHCVYTQNWNQQQQFRALYETDARLQVTTIEILDRVQSLWLRNQNHVAKKKNKPTTQFLQIFSRLLKRWMLWKCNSKSCTIVALNS